MIKKWLREYTIRVSEINQRLETMATQAATARASPWEVTAAVFARQMRF